MLTFTKLGVFALSAVGAVQGLSVRQAPDDIAALLGGSGSSSSFNGAVGGGVAIPHAELSAATNSDQVVFDTVRASAIVDKEIEVPDDVITAASVAPPGMRTITDESNAPVGELQIPDDIGGGEFSAASFATETFELAGVNQVVATNFNGTNCPPGQGRPIDQPLAPCTLARGNIEGFTFIDSSQNMIKEAGEVGIPAIMITISDKAATFRASVRTDNNGHYAINNLPPGTYYLTIDITKNPTGLTPVFDQTAVVVQPFTNALQDFPFQGAVPPVSQQTASAEAYVYVDANNNNVFDISDSPYSGAVVNLVNATTGTIVATARTEGTGLYSFTGLAPGAYIIRLDRASIVSILTPKLDTVNVQLVGGQVYTNANFALEPPAPSASIGTSYVFLDDNKNGLQETTETGLAGITVRLMTSVSQTVNSTVTAANGAFSFSNLVAGTYILQIDTTTLPVGYTPTFAEGRLVVTLTAGQTFANANLPVQRPTTGKIGSSRVYVDTNLNSIVDIDERGFAGVLVTLQDNTLRVAANITSDAMGFFYFTDVEAGDYAILVNRASVPSQYVIDSVNPPRINVQAGQTSQGFVIRLIDSTANRDSVGKAFVDDNRNGLPEITEAPVTGVSVLLLQNGQVLQTVKTDVQGNYTFTNVQQGTYNIKVDKATIPFGLSTVEPTGQYSLVVSGYTVGSVNIPFTKELMATIKGDIMANNLPLANVTVNIIDETGKLLQSVITNFAGQFVVYNLPAAVYNVQVDEKTIPGGLTPANPNTPRLSAAMTWNDTLNIEFRYEGGNNGNVGVGYVFNDLNGNGIKDLNEMGFAGVTVDMLNLERDVLTTLVTDFNGSYSFGDVRPGTYEVRVVQSTLPVGYNVTKPTVLITLDSYQGITSLAANFPATTFGYIPTSSIYNPSTTNYYPTTTSSYVYSTGSALVSATGLGNGAAISGLVFKDDNRNSIPDTGDLGIGRVTVRLLQNGQVVQMQETSANGRFSFRNLPSGTYSVEVEKMSLPFGHDMTRTSTIVTLYQNQDYYGSDVYFGAVATGAQSGAGIVGATYRYTSNVPIPNVVIRLMDINNNLVKQTLTGADGTFMFPNLPRGDYTVVLDQSSLTEPMILMGEPDNTLDGRVLVNVDTVPRTVTFRFDLF